MNEVVIQSLVIIVPIGALILGMYYFQSKQAAAMENRLREDAKDSENRLRGEIKEVAESVEIAKSELRTEIRELARLMEKGDSELAESVETAKSELSHRMDRMDDKISRLIQDVGVVQGAVLGVSVEAVPREQPAGTN